VPRTRHLHGSTLTPLARILGPGGPTKATQRPYGGGPRGPMGRVPSARSNGPGDKSRTFSSAAGRAALPARRRRSRSTGRIAIPPARDAASPHRFKRLGISIGRGNSARLPSVALRLETFRLRTPGITRVVQHLCNVCAHRIANRGAAPFAPAHQSSLPLGFPAGALNRE
jgi:hypothetical protein